MPKSLRDLDTELLQYTSEGLAESQKKLLQAQWPEIREVVSQNAGYRSWGSHLLHLDQKKLEELRKTFKETVRSVEGERLDILDFFIQKHPDLVGLRFLFDHRARLIDIPFSREAAKAIFLEYDPALVAQHRA